MLSFCLPLRHPTPDPSSVGILRAGSDPTGLFHSKPLCPRYSRTGVAVTEPRVATVRVIHPSDGHSFVSSQSNDCTLYCGHAMVHVNLTHQPNVASRPLFTSPAHPTAPSAYEAATQRSPDGNMVQVPSFNPRGGRRWHRDADRSYPRDTAGSCSGGRHQQSPSNQCAILRLPARSSQPVLVQHDLTS